MDPKALDATTLRSPETARDKAAEELVLGLTIAWHPDVRRVGDWVAIRDRTKISRLEPDFAPVAGDLGSPLSDPNVSRRPLEVAPLDDGGAELRVPDPGSVVRHDDVEVTGSRRFTRRELDDGVTLTVADRIALVLRRGVRPKETGTPHQLVGAGAALQRLVDEVHRVATTDVPVLIRGATGSGKELVARAIHARSSRVARPLIAVNMTTLAPSTAASQLFGHRKGAFTGAANDHAGFFEAAVGGTLFLDEIGETPAEVQAMLLRTLETGEVLRVGATTPVAVDVRVIAATDADLERAVHEERFRSPLLHRLAGYQISTPPLAARTEDIGLLLLHFLGLELESAGATDRLETRAPTDPMWLSARQVATLCRHPWPGNVRQLRNVARRLAIACGDLGEVPDAEIERALATGAHEHRESAPVPGHQRAPAPRAERKRRPEDISDDELVATMREHAWKTTATATALGISRTSLYTRIERCARVRKARDLETPEIESALGDADGDTTSAAAALEVSERGLVLRLRELGIDRDDRG